MILWLDAEVFENRIGPKPFHVVLLDMLVTNDIVSSIILKVNKKEEMIIKGIRKRSNRPCVHALTQFSICPCRMG